jgi:hypothetical protein
MVEPNWVKQIKVRGLGGAFGVFLDILEPLGPLGAQLLWVAQPTLRVFGAGETLNEVAQALEEPGGIERIRSLLNDIDNENDVKDINNDTRE